MATIISLVGLVVVFFLKEVPLRRTHAVEADPLYAEV